MNTISCFVLFLYHKWNALMHFNGSGHTNHYQTHLSRIEILLTWDEAKSYTVDPIILLSVPVSLSLPLPLSFSFPLREGDVYLEFDRFLEDRRTSRSLILRSEARLRDYAVTEGGNLKINAREKELFLNWCTHYYCSALNSAVMFIYYGSIWDCNLWKLFSIIWVAEYSCFQAISLSTLHKSVTNQ